MGADCESNASFIVYKKSSEKKDEKDTKSIFMADDNFLRSIGVFFYPMPIAMFDSIH